ncbi:MULTISPECIES: peptidoglycan D,D-transpeptidase FtsI family protein [unclassified Butyrivibrio]|uniref:peptidoglycan D,D-transpeptidase FtsI family protein n=1 Tax=unclassified Butyrivibrio TaxID=2639466 RepID=UPI00041C90EA|nr:MULTISPECIES: penicillin-binding protein 2 [unclassified Butyrivibrio]
MRRKSKAQKFTIGMKKKLAVLFIIVLTAFVGLSIRLILINRDNGKDYEKQVLSQQKYDSTTIPYRRGEILDANGTVLAYSEKVYNVILDAKLVFSGKDNKYLEPTVAALVRCFGFDEGEIRNYLSDHPDSQYYVLAKQLTYDQISEFQGLITLGSETYDENIQGVWFEENYVRKYPNGSMACDVVGFTTSDNNGIFGLEEYYNDTLSGSNGRTYGYIDEDSNLERTTIPATDGNSIVTTIDGNLQSIVEKYLQEFNDTYKDAFRQGNGANNVGCVIMDVNNGDVLAMASYPKFDLNDTKNTDNLIGMARVDERGLKIAGESVLDSGVYITQEMIDEMSEEEKMWNFNALWRNFCISDTYEPGSVAKPFTVATGIEAGCITGNEVYECTGLMEIGGHKIYCHNRYGDGAVSVERGIEISCNVAMMKIGQVIGADTFAKFQRTFGFGLKTNVDLAGEARTEGLTYAAQDMGSAELATGTFGQGFNVDMIEMITAFSSLVNGGKYYEPHVVRKILNSSGATIKSIEPRVLRQTISESTSQKIIQYCNKVVSGEEGTGKTARPAGYMIGGKTGTAETIPRKNRQYVVSFMGYAPADNPQIAIYVVVDRPNAMDQADAKFATRIVRKVLTEALPYLNIPMTEPVTEEEQAELDELREKEIMMSAAQKSEATVDADGNPIDTGEGTPLLDEDGNPVLDEDGNPIMQENTEGVTDGNADEEGEEGDGIWEKIPEDELPGNLDENGEPIWKSFEIDEKTGYYIDPETGDLINPEDGHSIGGEGLPDYDPPTVED